MSSLDLVADRWRIVKTATGDVALLGNGGHAEVYLVEDEGRLKKDDAAAAGDNGAGDGVGDERPRPGPKKGKKRYALKIDKRVAAGCVGTVKHETEVIRSLEGIPGVVRLAPELDEEEEEEEEEEDEELATDGVSDDGKGREWKRKRRKRSTVSGTLRDGRSWVVMELLGRNLAEASVAAGAVAPRRSGGSRGRRARAEEGQEAKGGGGGGESEGGGDEGEEGEGEGAEACWTAEDVRAAASSMLSSLAAMHAAGWIHRDVKPANFALLLPEEDDDNDDDDDEDDDDDDEDEKSTKKRPRNSAGDLSSNKTSRCSSNPARRWVAIDFGLSTRFLDANGVVLPPKPPEKRRSGVGAFSSAAASSSSGGGGGGGILFRGSTTYASPAAHSGRDASRRDDLWSWIYTVSELVVGTLPWREYDFSVRNTYASFEEAKAAARDRACAGKRAVAADPGALMGGAIGSSAEGGSPQPRTPGFVGVAVGVGAAVGAAVGSGGGDEQREAPTSSSRPAVAACPPALARAARHVASLGFRDAPDYALLAQCAAELPGPMRGRATRIGREKKRARRAADVAEEETKS